MSEDAGGIHDGGHDEPVEATGSGFVDDEFRAFPSSAFSEVVGSFGAFPALKRFFGDGRGFGVAGVVFGVKELEPGEEFEVS